MNIKEGVYVNLWDKIPPSCFYSILLRTTRAAILQEPPEKEANVTTQSPETKTTTMGEGENSITDELSF